MRVARSGAAIILALCCVELEAETQIQKVTVMGKLIRVMAVGSETSGWAIQTESEITIDGKKLDSIEVDYPDKGNAREVEQRARPSQRQVNAPAWSRDGRPDGA